jgi:hypothetical protein
VASASALRVGAQAPSENETQVEDPKAPNDFNQGDHDSSSTGDGFRVDASGDGTIGAEVSQPGTNGVRGPVSVTGAGGPPPCTHRPATYGEYPNVVPDGSGPLPDPADQVNRDNNGRAETGWVRECPGGGAADPFYWAPAAIDPVDLVPDALSRVSAQLAAPTPAINPDVTAGGIVNLGMWLAIDDPGTTTARAALAGVWAQVTATATSLEIDLGNGDTMTCDGLGTPIPDDALDSVDQGPCGYTYRQSSPDDDPYQLSITAVYDIDWTTSSGASGGLADIRRTVTLDYDVDEIQTIGVSN